MFTGIIETVGTVVSVRRGNRSAEIRVRTALTKTGTAIGDSVAVSGACRPVTRFVADAMSETLARTTLSRLKAGDAVNLERALRADARIGGHLVSGHVDGIGTVESVMTDGIARVVSIRCDRAIRRHVAVKGSVAIDGASLTVTARSGDSFSVALIPHTATATNLSRLRIGDAVNVECDLVSKYLDRLVGADADPGEREGQLKRSLSGDFLREHGFM